MNYIVTITSQGQISIPIELRRLFALGQHRKALVYPFEGDKIIIEPVPDLFSLIGAVKAKKRVPPQKIRAQFENYLASRQNQ